MQQKNWQQEIQQCRCLDRFRIRQLIKKSRTAENYAQIEKRITDSIAKVAAKKNLIPDISYPAQLPVSEKHQEIAEAISANQITIIAGETGSGKTTQIPKICLALGLGTQGIIGHTQPRRIAARTVASRITDELAENTTQDIAKQLVAYQVRFHDNSTENTAIKLMTDGVLLAEMQHDRFLNKYDTIIIDEAHERSLNIDFLLGYLKILAKKRRDLKIIITSATIDVEKFSKNFNDAPIIEVSGRTYPVEVIYNPPEDNQELASTIVNNIRDIIQIDKSTTRRDILVFCAGEREIRQASNAIRKAQLAVETVPLYARLSLAEQNKAFANSVQRKVILATNVAETSITVPNIGYVIDPGYARISRYSHRSKIQRLPIEAISQASANQRKGRSGRISEGICFRLYEEDDFASRPEFTEAEILRSNLASVILKMTELKLGDIREFPFIDQPDERLINDGYKLLEELQATTPSGKLSKIGKILSRLPIDPRYGRILYSAHEHQCLDSILIIISALSIQDPREYPADKKQAAEEKHKTYQDKKSDFITYLNLWQQAESQRQALSNKEFKTWCSNHYLSFMRLLEWRDLHRQLVLSCKQLNWPLREFALDNDMQIKHHNFEAIHRALISGLLGHIAHLDYKHEYQACRNRSIFIFPASSQFSKKPKWFVANTLIETTKVYAHCVANIQPEWILKEAQHLVKRHYFEPYYDKKSGLVNAYEKISLYGLTLVEKKSVYFGKIDPVESRKIFIREALVAGKYRTPGRADAKFYQHNKALIAEIESIEAKTRRRNLLVDDQILIDFYEARLPEKIINLASFERWRTQTEKQQAKLLFIDRALLINEEVNVDHIAQFPDVLDMHTLALPLKYHFEIGHIADGLSLQLPLDILHQCPMHIGDWLVPGLLKEKCNALIRLLPKEKRRSLVPIPETVDKIFSDLICKNEPLHQQLAYQLKRHYALDINEKDWQLDKLDDYYRLNYQLIDDKGQLIQQSRDLALLRTRYQTTVKRALNHDGSQDFCRNNLTAWDFDDLPVEYTYQKNGLTIRAYAYLDDNKNAVSIKLANSPKDADFLHRQGLLRLACLELKSSYKYLQKEILSKSHPSTLLTAAIGDYNDLREDIIFSALLQSCFTENKLPRRQADFLNCLKNGKANWIPVATRIEKQLIDISRALHSVNTLLEDSATHEDLDEILEDINYQLEHLFAEDFLFYTPINQLKHYKRYLKGIEARIDKALMNFDKEIDNINIINDNTADYYDLLNQAGYAKTYFLFPETVNYRIMFEELRVSLFAQQLKTAFPVSIKRMQNLWTKIHQGLY